MPTSNAWIMDESTRNRLLKKYKTQVASATSTVCATLAVVSAYHLLRIWSVPGFYGVDGLVSRLILTLMALSCRLLWKM
jgi:hypothetical protein